MKTKLLKKVLPKELLKKALPKELHENQTFKK